MVRIALFSDAFATEVGEIVVDKDMIKARYKDERVSAPLQYLADAALLEKGPLGKVRARIDIYDVIGNKYSFDAMLSEGDFHTLRGFLKNR